MVFLWTCYPNKKGKNDRNFLKYFFYYLFLFFLGNLRYNGRGKEIIYLKQQQQDEEKTKKEIKKRVSENEINDIKKI